MFGQKPSLLAIESAIVERLRARLPSEVGVYTGADLSSINEGNQPSPAVHVLYQGYAVTEDRPDGRAARIMQTWTCVVAVRNARAQVTADAARADAGEIAHAVCAALMGWRPIPELASAHLKASVAPGAAAGFFYLPLSFVFENVVHGDPE